MKHFADIAIIGGGASGLTAAITAKRKNPALQVTVLEGLDRVGKKLITTGNGRCNISNKNLALSRFHGEDRDFCRFAIQNYADQKTKAFFSSIGVDFSAEGDKLYPSSFQASSVVDALRFECEKIGVNIILNCKITDIIFGKKYILKAENWEITASAIIVAAGLYSGGEKIGSDGSVLRILKQKGFTAVKTTPAIVQLKTETDFVKQLKGIKTDALATLLCEGEAVCNCKDEVLFCEYGLSGPAILQISRQSARDDKNYSISLDLYPDTDVKTLANYLVKRVSLLPDRILEDFFTGSLNKRLGQVVLKYIGYKMSDKVSSLTDDDCEKIALALKNFSFKVLSNTGFLNSQVTAGGLSTKEFDDKTLVNKKYKNLFAAGEILDIDGDCGGFNLAWAWATGILAGESAVDCLCS